ncbi:von Willebrand factor A domain-containing protein 5A-like [Mercenaria mercenaria]|uniref:von Willebrand factor A domain-containing protein 5A-like n=1 Tax=Mercenaria mercenaria TaxID=6596 RepID=UPI00234EA6B2|nr:von Willebrand factor A domain-containing protein 5A-like [Mercenaria mercenaria]
MVIFLSQLQVFVLTDGGVSNTDQVIGLVKTQSLKTSTRVFSLGIGHGMSTALVKGIANNGGGKAEFTVGGDRVQSKVVSLLKCAMQPAITDVTINWYLPPDVTPVSIPTEPPTLISNGERLTLFAVLQGVNKEKDYPESSVTLKGQQDGKPLTYRLNFVLGKSSEVCVSAPVHRLATKLQIKLLQDEESAMLSEDTYHISPDLGKEIKTFRQRIVDLSRHGNIVSKYSAFVAIDSAGKKVENKAVERSCPVPTLSKEYMSGIQPVLRTAKCCCVKYLTMRTQVHKAESSCSNNEGVDEFCLPEPRYKEMGPCLDSDGVDEFCLPEPRSKEMYCDVVTKDTVNTVDDLPLKSADSAQNKQFCRSAKPLADLPLKATDNAQDKQLYNKSAAPIHQRRKKGFRSKFKFPSFSGSFSKKSKDKDNKVSKCYEGPDVHQSVSRRYSEMSSDADGKFSSDDKMMSVIALQQLHGEWEVSEQLFKLLGVPKEEFDKQTFSEVPSIVCTVIVLCWLRKQFPHRHEEWQMIETKALTWLASQKVSTSVEDIIQQTTQSLWP